MQQTNKEAMDATQKLCWLNLRGSNNFSELVLWMWDVPHNKLCIQYKSFKESIRYSSRFFGNYKAYFNSDKMSYDKWEFIY